MARLSANDVELIYPSSNANRCDWFGIKGDKQTKQVRILYNTIEDVYFDVVHEVSVNNRTKTVACLNSHGESVDSCPMCKAGYQQRVLMYVPILDLTDNKIKLWGRSKGFLAQIQGLMMRNNPLSGTVFEIMRNGAPRDPKTTYLFQPLAANDGTTVETILNSLQVQLPEQSSYVDVYDFNQMQIYVQNLESVQGSIPANRGGAQFGGQPQFNAPQQQFGVQPQYGMPQQQFGAPQGGYYQQPMAQPQFSAPQQPQYGAPQAQGFGVPQQQFNAAPQPSQFGVPQTNEPAATQPMVPPQNVSAPGAYNPQAVPQNPANMPVRRPTTPVQGATANNTANAVPPMPPQPQSVAASEPSSTPLVGTNTGNPSGTADDVPF